MTRGVLAFLGLLVPLAALAQSTPDLVSQGDDKKMHGDFKGAVADYTQAIAQDAKNVRAYLGRATVRSLENNYDAAIADDTKAIALDPENAVAFSNRGNARTAKGDLSGALADYTQAVTLDPHHVRAFLNRGNIKNLQKQYSAAIEDYSEALALDPKNAAAFYNRAGAKKALGYYDDAATDYSQAINLNPVDVQAYLNRAVLRMAQGKWDVATSDLNKCISLVPEERQAYPRIYLWVVDVKKGAPSTPELSHALNTDSKLLNTTWGWQIAQFLADQVKETTFLAAAKSFQAKKDKHQAAQAFYYVGLKHGMAGDKAGAVGFFKKCEASGDPSLHEFILAREELKLSGDVHK